MSDPDFVRELCGFRPQTGLPSTSDKGDKNSVRWGRAMFEALGVEDGTPEKAEVGALLEEGVVAALRSLRPDLTIERSRLATSFTQYQHLTSLQRFTKGFKNDLLAINDAITEAGGLENSVRSRALKRRLARLREHAASNELLFGDLVETLAEESMLKLDITVSSPRTGTRLLVGLSSKWTLRTDRAQDCVSQGGKLVSLRRGHMPHYAVVTMEPRPSMLKLLADGSGAVDCVYHVAFNALQAAAETLSAAPSKGMPKQLVLLDRMIKQDRIRPFSALATELELLP